MRKILSSVAVAVLAATQAFADVDINATNFPNATFRSYVSQNFDENSDGILSNAEIANAKTVDIQVGDDTGLMTPSIGDIKDTSSGKYILNLPTYLNQDVNSIAFKTRGTLNTEVHVLP